VDELEAEPEEAPEAPAVMEATPPVAPEPAALAEPVEPPPPAAAAALEFQTGLEPTPEPEPEPPAEAPETLLAPPAAGPELTPDVAPSPAPTSPEPPPPPVIEPETVPEPTQPEPPRPAPRPPVPIPPVQAPPRPKVQLPPPPGLQPARRRGGLGRLVGRVVGVVVVLALLGPPLGVMIYKVLPPPFTILMLERLVQGQGLDYQWRPLSQMAPALSQAAIAAEDAHFCQHHGFDFAAMQKAMRQNARAAARGGDKVRGGSTISQQTAKNVFLWPGRSYVRKGAEAWYTVLTEAVWGKRRIMEMYLNVAEMGPGIYGAQAASQYYFHEDADQLSPSQAAHLIAVLPSPLKWKVTAPGRYVARRSRRIGGAMGAVRQDGLASCLRD
jgi:monofunctional biosynthetic peptidoglycan transglycosylase